MSDGFLPRLRRGQPYDASFDRPDRVRRTHANPEIIATLKRLPVLSRLQRNKEILDSNAQRRLHHIRDPTAQISDVESIISIETSELDIIRSDSITFDLYKPFMDPLTIAELKRRNEEDWKKECEDRRRVSGESNQDNNGNPTVSTITRPQTFTLEPDITLIRQDPTQPAPLFFPTVLKLTAKHTKFIPLNFFTDKNLSFINTQINDIKITHEVDKPYILLIPDITSRIQASALAGPASESSMSYVKWLNASDNFIEFEASRFDRGHESSRVKFLSQHFTFFSQQNDAEELFQFWRPTEEHLRRNHVELNTDFDGLLYAMKWTEHITRIILKEAVEEAVEFAGYTLTNTIHRIPFDLATGTTLPLPVASDAAKRGTLSKTTSNTGNSGQATMGTNSFPLAAVKSAFPSTYSVTAATVVAPRNTFVRYAEGPTGLENSTVTANVPPINPFTSIAPDPLLFHDFSDKLIQ
ncbi:hypothetical protein GGU11DRAFT_880740 [Lentinula aff. detonsa]|uniref:Uncharacterized protein n=2 Tax=Lentinula TaxID=5352 RepID=A0AA38NNB1_9AGAR|nr:hypothetical protein GGU10DRAFT_415984 [Lentinula aff. detonsa]KAJ3792928.1 hypothetical protein GGU11DRAFT_880740 [Lentinula aff. detonsa]